jgi:hypothetical protein
MQQEDRIEMSVGSGYEHASHGESAPRQIGAKAWWRIVPNAFVHLMAGLALSLMLLSYCSRQAEFAPVGVEHVEADK